MNGSKLYVEVVTHKTNLNFTTQLALDGDKWSVVVGNNKIRSYRQFRGAFLPSVRP